MTREVTAGFIIGLVTLIKCLSLAALVFSGALLPHLPGGMGVFVAGGTVLLLITALCSPLAPNVSTPKNLPVAIVAAIAASLAIWPGMSPEALMPTVLALLALTSVGTGAVLYLMGLLRLGQLAYFMPYAVTGGFLAATGWLMAWGAIPVMLSAPDTTHGMVQLGAGVAFGVAALVLQRRERSHYLLLHGLVLGSVASFHLIAYALGMDMAALASAGYVLGASGASGEPVRWTPELYGAFGLVDWKALSAQRWDALAVVLVSTVNLLLNLTGVELSLNREIDLDRELKATGLANMASGALTGPVGYGSVGSTIMAQRAGSSGRLATIIAALMLAAVLMFGMGLFSYIPRFVLGGFLLSIGLGLLVQWIYDAWSRLSRLEYALVLLVLGAVVAFGFIEGVAVGILIAMATFIVDYSRIKVVRNEFTGRHYASNVERSGEERAALEALSAQVYVLQLQGYIFFGTADQLLKRVKAYVRDESHARPKFVVMDFSHVTQIDSSVVFSFEKLKRFLGQEGITLVLVSLSEPVRQFFGRAGYLEASGIKALGDMDHGLEWCENRLLMESRVSERLAKGIKGQLREMFSDERESEEFFGYLKRVDFEPGQVLMRQGEQAGGMYFIEQGYVEVSLEGDQGSQRRLKLLGAGTVVGEMGIYTHRPRAASVTAQSPGVSYYLSQEDFMAMEREQPALAASFHRAIVLMLSDRLVHANRSLSIFFK